MIIITEINITQDSEFVKREFVIFSIKLKSSKQPAAVITRSRL
jgi:hypothetical protein